jgi:hypothetical protein
VGTVAASGNPVKRLFAYMKAREIRADMADIMEEIKKFYTVPGNIYRFDIKQELVTDSILISTSAGSNGYPTNEFIYNLIGKLRNYAAAMSAKQTGYPMLNISTANNINFEVKVALPVDKELPSAGDILQKRMPGGGNILVTEVKGGIWVTNEAMDQVKKYADDYMRVPPAIPFYSLITDRLKEPDSSKWVTKIYFPVK